MFEWLFGKPIKEVPDVCNADGHFGSHDDDIVDKTILVQPLKPIWIEKDA